jgi:hypothetical protein
VDTTAQATVEEANPFREAAGRIWLAAEAPDLEPEQRERLMRQGQWCEEEAARRDLRRRVVPAPRGSAEALPRRIPGQSWETVTGMPLDHVPHPANWSPNDAGAATLERMVDALRRHPP